MNLNIDTPRWAVPFFNKQGQLKQSRYKGIYGGRGSGKSHEACGWVPDIMLMGYSVVCVRETQKSLSFSSKRLIESKVRQFGLEKHFEIQNNLIKGPYNTMSIFIGMQDYNAENIQSLENFPFCLIEQAEKLSQNSLDLLRPTIRPTKEGDRSEIWAIWNPKEESDPIDAFLRKEAPDDSIVVEANYPDNPWFPDVLRQEMEYDKKHDYEKYLHVWKGKYRKITSALVFKNWREEEFDIPADVVKRQGADWGFSVDPTVLIQSYVVGKTLFVCHEAYEIGCELDNIPVLFGEVPESNKWPIVADSSRPDTISYVKRHGYPKIYKAAKGKGSVEDGIEHLQSYEIVVHPRCKHTIKELENYKWKTEQVYCPDEKRIVDRVLPILEDKHNHVIDSLRYSEEGYRRAKNPERKRIEPQKPLKMPLAG